MKNRGLLYKRVGLIAVLAFTALRGEAVTNITENLTLDADLDLREHGTVMIAAGATVDLNGHKLIVKGLSCAGNIINSESGYQLLEYIQSNGKQWIDTGYVTSDKTAIEIDFTATGDWGNDKAYFCGEWGVYGHVLALKPLNGKNAIVFYGSSDAILYSSANMRYRFVTVPGGAKTAILYDGAGNQLAATSPSLNHSGNGTMTLFAENGDGDRPSSYCLHSFKLTDTTTGKVERDFVPVRRVVDGEIGLYDRANDVFYPKHENSTAPFIAGGTVMNTISATDRLLCAKMIVDQEDSYQKLYAIESTGCQWIDTGYVTSDKTAIDIDFTATGDWGNDKAYFCGEWGAYGHVLALKPMNGKNAIVFYGSSDAILYSSANMRYRFVTVPGGAKTAILYDGAGNQLAATSPSLNHSGNGTMTLFAENGNGDRPSSYRLHSFRMTDTDTGTVVRDYVPVRRLSDGEVGLYDQQNGMFCPKHPNSTEPFVGCADVIVSRGRLCVDVSDDVDYVVSGLCDVRVELLDGSVLSADADLSCFGGNLEVLGKISLNGHTLTVQGLSGSGAIINSEPEYQLLSYIESTGAQWIDTDYVTSDKTAIEIDFTAIGDWGNDKAYFCGEWGVNGHVLALKPLSGKNAIVFYGGGDAMLYGNSNMRYRFVTVPGGEKTAILYDGTGNQLAAKSPSLKHSGNGTMTLFAENVNGTRPSSYRLHSFKMTDTETGTVIRDFVPVRRIVDDELGLYDRANNIFYPKHPNSSASFVPGDDLSKQLVTEMSGSLVLSVPRGESTELRARMYGVKSFVKTGEGSVLVPDAVIAGVSQVQIDAGGVKVVREDVVKPEVCLLPATADFVLTVEKGAQYWDDVYVPEAIQNRILRIAGTGPDGTGAVRTTKAAPNGINNALKAWCKGIELLDDAEIARDAYAFSLVASDYGKLPLKLNGHTLTFTSDTLTDPTYLLASSVCGTSDDTGTIVIGDNIQFYPYKNNDSDLSNYTLVMSENASYSTGADSNARNLIVGNFAYRSTLTLSETNKLTTVIGSYAPVSTSSAPKVQLGDAEHLVTMLDLSERTTTLDVDFGGGLKFFENAGAVVTVRLGARRPKGDERKLLSWTSRPQDVRFVSEDKLYGVVARENGLYFVSGLTIVVR